MEEDAPASSSSGGGNVAQAQSSSSSGTTKMSGHEGGDGCKETATKRKAEEEHSEDPERSDGKWLRTEGNKRKAGGRNRGEQTEENGEILEGIGQGREQEEARQCAGSQVRFSRRRRRRTTEEEPRQVDEGGDLDPEQVRPGPGGRNELHDQDAGDV